jgi:Na+-translocating ferredoxin:NAD+ oxidoreductase RnfC subunit
MTESNTKSAEREITQVKEILEKCGVVGAGGAGFPTHLKIDSRANTILLNCAECEPLLQVDQQLLARYAEEILFTLQRLAKILEASVVVAVKKSFTETISAVKEKLSKYPNIRLALLDSVYPAGDEIILIYEAAGIVVPPGSVPLDAGCVVFNTETVYNMYNAIEHGKPVTHKWVTITGEVERPVTAHVPVGISIEDAVKRAGKITIDNPVFIAGGPMMGSVTLPRDKIKKTTKAILVLPAEHNLARVKTGGILLNRIASACCQCRVCTDMCPRYLLGYPLEPHKIMRALCARDTKSDAFHGIMYCGLCGLCEKIACPQSLAPRELIKTVKTELSKAGIKPEKHEAAPVSWARHGRSVAQNRLKIRLGLEKYDRHAPLEDI